MSTVPPVGSKTGDAVNLTLSSEYFQLQDRQPTNHVSHSENIILQFDCLSGSGSRMQGMEECKRVVINSLGVNRFTLPF